MPVLDEEGRPDVSATYDRGREFLDEAENLAEGEAAERCAAALTDFQWYWENALEYKPSQYGVRLSFFLGKLLRLAEIYAPAADYYEELIAQRDQALRRGQIEDEAFGELCSLYRSREDHRNIIEALKVLAKHQDELAEKEGPWLTDSFIEEEDWEMMRRFPPAPSRIVFGYKGALRRAQSRENKRDERYIAILRKEHTQLLLALRTAGLAELAEELREELEEVEGEYLDAGGEFSMDELARKAARSAEVVARLKARFPIVLRAVVTLDDS